MKTKPETTPNCCAVWPKLIPRFDWHVFQTWPDLVTLAYISDNDGTQWRINHCPACGANQRDAVRLVSEVRR